MNLNEAINTIENVVKYESLKMEKEKKGCISYYFETFKKSKIVDI